MGSAAQDRWLDTAHGRFAARDYGGDGPALLLVHGTGHNLEVWTPLARRLRSCFHVHAFDLRGHGRTGVDSTDGERYWRDIQAVIHALGLRAPWLVGHSTGAYAVTAHAAAGGGCAGLALLDGFVLDPRPTPAQAAAWRLDRERPWREWRLGWRAQAREMEAWIEAEAARAQAAGLPADTMAAVLRRAFRAEGDGYLRRPTLDDLEAVCRNDPEARIYPEPGLYERVRQPMLLMLAARGPYAARRAELEALAGQGEGRRLAVIDAGHNLHLEQPETVARLITAVFTAP